MLADFPEAFGSSLQKEVAYDEAGWRAFVAAVHPIALKVGGEIAGTAGYRHPVDDDPAVAMIVSMYIGQEFRDRGLGRKILEEILKSIRLKTTANRAILKVYPGNETALHLYEAVGFREEPTRGQPAGPAEKDEEVTMEMTLV